MMMMVMMMVMMAMAMAMTMTMTMMMICPFRGVMRAMGTVGSSEKGGTGGSSSASAR